MILISRHFRLRPVGAVRRSGVRVRGCEAVTTSTNRFRASIRAVVVFVASRLSFWVGPRQVRAPEFSWPAGSGSLRTAMV